MDAESLFHLLGDESSSRPTNAEILTYFNEHKDHAERCQFLKSGYQNVYTYLQVEGRYIGYHAAGEFLEVWEGNYLTKTAQSYLTWDAVSQSIAGLMETGQFLVPLKQPPAPEIQQLTLTGEQEKELGLPNEASQQIQIAKFKEHKTIIDASGKYITESDITDVLKRGSLFSDGKYRIQRHFSETSQNTQAESIAFLKKEFGTGGFSWILANETHGFVDFNASGYTLTSYGDNCHYKRKLRWPEVAKRLQLLIHNDQYLTDKEKDEYKVWLEQEQAKQNVVTPEKPPVEVPAPQAPAPGAQPVRTGDTVYLEGDKAFLVESIGWADVQLRDESFPLISRAINREEFSRLMQANPKNNHFLPPEPAQGEQITDSGDTGISLLEQVGVPDLSELPHEPINYAAPADSDIPSAPREKYAANVAAIRLLKEIEQRVANGGPPANADEQEVLAKYTGWGGLPDVFDPEKSTWSHEHTQLKELLTETEYTDARSSTLTAFYTPPEIIRAMYRALERFGVQQGNILEPSMGVGAFFANAPESFSVNHAHLYGVELDALTGRLAKQLYQNAHIQITGFEQASLPDNFFDCVVGNVPFGDFQVNDPKYNRLHFQIHDYFFAKAVDKLRPGGILAFLTSSGTMDKQSSKVRSYLAARCDLIGAVRLPNTAFQTAGTKTTTDIVFLQKRDSILDRDEPWLHLGENADGISMNQYFVDHPEMICGTMQMVSGPYGPTAACLPFEDDAKSLEARLDAALGNLHATLPKAEILLPEEDAGQGQTIDADPTVRNYSYTIRNDRIYYREGSLMRECRPGPTQEKRIRSLIELRDTTRTLIDAQLHDEPEEEILRLQSSLNRLYDEYQRRHGLINSRAASLCFRDDDGYFLLCSLEVLDDKGNFKGKSDIFTKRTIRPNRTPAHAETASDAFALSIGERARVDMPYMMELTGKDEQTLVRELTGVIFVEPFQKQEDGSPVYLAADEYLSGDVRQKLRTARVAAEQDPAFRVNVQALEQVQPRDLTASEISVRLGATWIEPATIKEFADELFSATFREADIQVSYNEYLNSWYLSNNSYGNSNIKVTTTYGTKRVNAYHLLENALNLRSTKIFDIVRDENGDEKRVPNIPETEAAQAKQRAIEDAFKDWIFKDRLRRETLVKKYNELYNSIRPREYDGSHIHFVGMNPEIQLRPHQRNAIAHILYGHNTLLAHVVGAGKTYEMVAAAMEKKRLGLCSKTMVTVPNHLTGQFASEALVLYPNAKILVTSDRDFEKDRRKRLCAKIATGDYDIIVIGHSQFLKIPISLDRQIEFLDRQVAELETQIALEADRRSMTVKQLERMKKRLTVRLKGLMDSPRRDDVVTFEELGVDSLMVDEAHNYKNLMTSTKMSNVAGVNTTEAQKSTDLLMKCQYLDEITQAHGITFATGTPISNSMTELYTMQRYLQSHTLRQRGLASFDSWAATFGETVTSIELAPEGTGYRSKERFAKFYNLPELMAMFKECADIQTADMLKLPVPALKGGKPCNIQIKPSEIQKIMVQELGKRADRVRSGSVDPTVDNMLSITNDGRKLALDQRLLNPLLPDDPASKVNVCVEKIYQIWQESADHRSAQLVFSDLSTPTGTGFNVYDDIKSKLIARGVPAEEIAFIHDAATDAKKKELFAQVRSGAVRILLGSTAKMGAGTNVQKRLIALHHLDVPWRPSDIEQREGRILRQGNENKEVSIFRYVTEGTFDAYSWQLIENKQRFISQIMTSKSPARSADDIDDAALSYAEVKALAAGNPIIKEKMDLDIQLTRLRTLKAAYNNQHYELENRIAVGYPAAIKQVEQRIQNAVADAKTIKTNTLVDEDGKEVFSLTLMDTNYTEKEPAGRALLGLLGLAMNAENPVPVGRYLGLEVSITFYSLAASYEIILTGKGRYSTSLGADVLGNLTRLHNLAAGIQPGIERCQNELAQLQQQLAAAKEEVGRPFPQEQELAEKTKRQAELEVLLKLNDRDTSACLLPDAEQQPPAENRQRGQGAR